MPITISTDADLDAVFKDVYLELGSNLYSTYDAHYSRAKKTFGTLGAQNSKEPIETTFGGGVGASSDGTLPEASHSSFIDPLYSAKRNYARVKIDNLTIEGTEKTEAAFVKMIDHEVTSKLRNFNRHLARQQWNDGTGILGQFTGPAGGTAAAPTCTILTTGTYRRRKFHFEKGELLQVNTLTSLFKVTSYVHSTGVLTLERIQGSDDLTGLAATTHSIYTQGSRNAETYGYLGIYANSSHYGTAQEDRYQPVEVDGASAPLDTGMLTDAVEMSSTECDENVTDIVFAPLQYRKYIKLLEDQKRYPIPVEFKPRSNAMTTPELIARVSYGGIQYVGSTGNIVCSKGKFVRDDMVVGANFKHNTIMHVKKPGWAQRDGTVFMRIDGVDAYEARYVAFTEQKINPWYQWFIADLSIT